MKKHASIIESFRKSFEASSLVRSKRDTYWKRRHFSYSEFLENGTNYIYKISIGNIRPYL